MLWLYKHKTSCCDTSAVFSTHTCWSCWGNGPVERLGDVYGTFMPQMFTSIRTTTVPLLLHNRLMIKLFLREMGIRITWKPRGATLGSLTWIIETPLIDKRDLHCFESPAELEKSSWPGGSEPNVLMWQSVPSILQCLGEHPNSLTILLISILWVQKCWQMHAVLCNDLGSHRCLQIPL